MAISPEYIAGFLDGDGCIHIRNREKSPTFTISFAQNEDGINVLTAIKDYLLENEIECKLTGPHAPTTILTKSGLHYSHKGMYHLFITNIPHCILLLHLIGKFLIRKREKMLEALTLFSERESRSIRGRNKTVGAIKVLAKSVLIEFVS